jgi:Domain of unknown function (DUF4124)
MRKALLLMTSLVFAGAAGAQHKWVDQNGRIQYGDTPPTGARSSPLRAPAGPGYRPEAKEDQAGSDEAKADEVKKAPMTTAEKEADFRRRQQEAEKEREKQAKAQEEVATKRENCARAKENLRVLEGGRVARIDSKGERYYLDDAQLAQEAVRARRDQQEWCS